MKHPSDDEEVNYEVSDATEHPAKFSAAVMEQIEMFIKQYVRHRPLKVTDPFAGVGGVHALRRLPGVTTVGIELEPEWARRVLSPS